MSWISDILDRLEADATLSGLVVARIYAQVAPAKNADGTPLTTPYLVWQRVSCNRIDSMDGASGLATQRLQFAAWDEDYTDALAVMDAVRGSIDGFDGTLGATVGMRIRIMDEADQPDLPPEDDSRQLNGIRQDYQVWHNE